MENKQFSTVHLSSLGVDDAYALFQATVGLVEPAQSAISEVAKAIFTRLSANTATMGNHMKQGAENAYTSPINTLDADRDDELADIKRDIVYFAKGRDLTKKAAAERLKIAFDPYWNTNEESLNTETQSINTLLAKIDASTSLKADAQLIGIDTKLATLGTKNRAFETLYKTRTSDQGNSIAAGSASTLRRAANKNYNDFCTAIELAASYTDGAPILNLFNTMEQLRKKYNALATATKKENSTTTTTK